MNLTGYCAICGLAFTRRFIDVGPETEASLNLRDRLVDKRCQAIKADASAYLGQIGVKDVLEDDEDKDEQSDVESDDEVVSVESQVETNPDYDIDYSYDPRLVCDDDIEWLDDAYAITFRRTGCSNTPEYEARWCFRLADRLCLDHVSLAPEMLIW